MDGKVRVGHPEGSEGEQLLFELKYGPSATIWQINRGWVGTGDVPKGYTLDTERGVWVDRKQESEGEPDALKADAIIEDVRLIVRNIRNLLLARPVLDTTLSSEARLVLLTTLQYALQWGIVHRFQLEEQEIASARLGEEDWLLFWETSEGSAGVLRDWSRTQMVSRRSRE